MRRFEEIRDAGGVRKISDQRIEIPLEYYYVNVNANISISAKRWYTVMEVIDEVASALKMDRDTLAKASIKAFLDRELRCIEAEIYEIGAKHGAKSIFELDDKLKRGEVREEDILEDFQELDYLEARRDDLLAAMKKLQHQL